MRVMLRCVAAGFALILSALSAPARGQIIGVKTVPLAESEQFAFFPSGWASSLIAIPDTLQDPFANPATAARLKKSYGFSTPTFYSASGNAGSASTVPVGAFLIKSAYFAALGAATQSVDRPRRDAFSEPLVIDVIPGPESSREESPRRNRYGFGLVGGTWRASRLSLGASVVWSGLNAVDGVDQFYFGSHSIRQSGDGLDARVGVLKEWSGGRALELTGFHNRLDHSHDVWFRDFAWDPAQRRLVSRDRRTRDGEDTQTWGVHLKYTRPVADSNWRIGAILTANSISRPRIPGYDLYDGLGTAGEATAYNIGLGVGRATRQSLLGLDAIYEPVRSTTRTDGVLANRFRFSNARLRAFGARSFELLAEGTSLRLEGGLEFYSVKYVMNQEDFSHDVQRDRNEAWLERSRFAGMSFDLSAISMHYRIRTKSGVGRPGVVGGDDVFLGGARSLFPSPPAAPSGTLGAVRLTWHQFGISVPMR